MNTYAIVTTLADRLAWPTRVHDIVQQKNEPWLLYADDHGTDANLRVLLKSTMPRYVFFLNWSGIVSAETLALSECVNFHCTALPYGRGGHPIENLLLRGHRATVMTAHRMTTVIDGGPIYAQDGPISLAGTKAEILGRFVDPVARLVRLIIDRHVQPCEQQGHVVEFGRLTPEDYAAFWQQREEATT